MAVERGNRPSRYSRSPPHDSSRGRERSNRAQDRDRSRERSTESRDLKDERDRSSRRHDLSIAVCKDFTRGRCARSILECRYAHPPPTVDVEGEMVTICYDSLRDRCARGYGCRYFHPPPHIRLLTQEAVGIDPSPPSNFHSDQVYVPPTQIPMVVPTSAKATTRPSLEVCRDFVRGRCSRDPEDCRYAHHIPSAGDGDHVVICQDFVRGKCGREKCRYFHPPKHLCSQINDVKESRFEGQRVAIGQTSMLPMGASSAWDHGHYNPSTLGSYTALATNLYEEQVSKQLRADDLGHHWQGSTMDLLYGGGHPSSLFYVPPAPVLTSSSTSNDEDKLQVCRDFLRRRCDRETSCRYAHPEPHNQVVENYVTLCRDFQRGKCSRDRCRFYHPSTKGYASLAGNNGRSQHEKEDFDASVSDGSDSPEMNGNTS